MSVSVDEDTSYLLFGGSYTNFDILAHLPHNDKVGNGVYCMTFENGKISILEQVPCDNPAVIHFDKRDCNILYVLSEGIVDNGLIHTIRINPQFCDKSGKMVLSSQSDFVNESEYTGGKSLCYFGTNRKHGIAINYWEGSVDVFELDAKKSGILKSKGIIQHIEHNDIATKIAKLENRRQVKHREDHWVNRQCGSHAHSSHFWKEWVFIPDLGDNCIYQYRYYENGKNGDSSKILDYECMIGLENGCGPRHMVFHPTLNAVYVSNELNSTVTVLSLLEKNNNDLARMKPIQYVSTICKTGQSSQKDSKNYVAEICLSPCGNDIYVSNRGHDTIAHFRIDLNNNGKIIEESKEFIPTYGQCPRHFAMSPNGKYLLVANQDTNSISIFERNVKNGSLTYKSQFVDKNFGAPNFLLFYPISNNVIKNRKTEKQQIIKNNHKNNTFGRHASMPMLAILASMFGMMILFAMM